MQKYTFDAKILQRSGMDATYVEFPYDVQDEFGVKGRVPVRVQFDGVPYQGSLVKMGTDCHIMGLTKAIRKQIGKQAGDTVHVQLTRDTAKREVRIPENVHAILRESAQAKQFFDGLSYTNQKEYIRWITSAKRPETTQRRLKNMLTMLEKGVKHPWMVLASSLALSRPPV